MPQVKPLIWNQLPAPVCTQDSKSQKMQNAVIALLVATVKATNHVLQQQPSGKAQDKEIITYLTDAIALSLQCYHDINSIRCQAMKKISTRIMPHFKLMCNQVQLISCSMTLSLWKLTN